MPPLAGPNSREPSQAITLIRRPDHGRIGRNRRRDRQAAGRPRPQSRAGRAAQGEAHRARRRAERTARRARRDDRRATSARRRREASFPAGSTSSGSTSRSSSTTPASPPAARSTRPIRTASSSRYGCSSRRSWPHAVFSPAMVERGRGAILNVASTAGMQPMPYSAGYSAAKAYVLTFSEALHQEMRGHGVTVTALAPGPVETDFWQIAGWETASGKSFERAVPGTLISSEHAARAGVEGLDHGERVVVPGLPMRVSMLAARYIPHALKLPALERFMRSDERAKDIAPPRAAAARRDQRRASATPTARRGRRARSCWSPVPPPGVGRRDRTRLGARRRCRAAGRAAGRAARGVARADRGRRRQRVRPPVRPVRHRPGRRARRPRCSNEHGHVDVVVSNAGLSIRRWISESYDRFRRRRAHDQRQLPRAGAAAARAAALDARARHAATSSTSRRPGVDFPPVRWSAYIASKARVRGVAQRASRPRSAPTA